MKKQYILVTCVFLIIGASYSVSAQSDCKVYPSKLTEKYTGECKKGLAQGQGKAQGIDMYEGEFRKGYPNGVGTYTWKNGNVYVGEFKKGQKEGKGVFTFQMNGKDSTTVGYWRSDEYIGKDNKPPYRVMEEVSVDRISFRHSDSDRDEISIEFYQNGVRNGTVNNLLVQNSSGNYTTQGNYLQIKDIELPFVAIVRYTTLTAMKSATIPCSFKFEINQKGEWAIRVNN